MNLGSKILELRKQQGVTQEELAAALGVTAAAVSKWENNYTLPDVLMLCALADYFTVTTDELLGRAKTLRFAVIAAETPVLGQKAAAIAREYGIVARSVHTDFEQAKAAAAEDEFVRYLIACYTSGFYGGCEDAACLVSVAPTEEEILSGLCYVIENYVKD